MILIEKRIFYSKNVAKTERFVTKYRSLLIWLPSKHKMVITQSHKGFNHFRIPFSGAHAPVSWGWGPYEPADGYMKGGGGRSKCV